MIINFTVPPEKYNQSWTSTTLAVIRQALTRVVSQSEAAPRIILRSPNGTTYSVTVSDVGALVVAAETGKTRTL